MSDVSKIYVAPSGELKEGSRMLVKCGIRNIAVIRHRGSLYAIDNACYHHGGPLLNGDIEDMGGHPCIVCPWHSYRIALDSGEGLYVGIDIDKKTRKATESVKTKGCKQRTHRVVEEEGKVYVLVDLTGPAIESDTYANMALANQEGASNAPKSGAAPLRIHSDVRSGQVFQKMSKSVNPFSDVPKSPVFEAQGGGSGGGNCVVSCYKAVEVCKNVKEFFFQCVSGSLLRFCEPGEYVELELPLKEDGVSLRRKWTVCNPKGGDCFFTIMVKSYPDATKKGGSAWLHQYGIHSLLKVVRVGGSFTLNDHMTRIKALQGNVLFITAGIGIASAYANVNAYFNDPLSLEYASSRMNILHLHVDRETSTVAKLDTLLDIAKRFSPEMGLRECYRLHCFLSRQERITDGTYKGGPFTLGRRLNGKDVLEQTTAYFGDGVPFLAFVCGPTEFINDCTSFLLSAGASESDIIIDDY
ncbi:hypothetical protein AGDE_06345 [Angomonas deanei]|nr:hypothetical protein AGDE_08531 [Angomonas deanei]EPY37589.1 hypothetical protein AGDE_06345 [Angomonas deanei]|eukprot:EPY32602.1 hypothetical protein AGDE_08531 [Angomonas deanei]